MQHAVFLTGVTMLFAQLVLMLFVPSAQRQGMGYVTVVAGMGVILIANRIKQRWETLYRGHHITFENGILSAERLYIDGVRVARGGFGRKMELAGTIPSGEGAGDRIIAWVDARVTQFRLRLFAEPAVETPSTANGAQPELRYQHGEAKPSEEKLPPPPAASSPPQMLEVEIPQAPNFLAVVTWVLVLAAGWLCLIYADKNIPNPTGFAGFLPIIFGFGLVWLHVAAVYYLIRHFKTAPRRTITFPVPAPPPKQSPSEGAPPEHLTGVSMAVAVLLAIAGVAGLGFFFSFSAANNHGGWVFMTGLPDRWLVFEHGPDGNAFGFSVLRLSMGIGLASVIALYSAAQIWPPRSVTQAIDPPRFFRHVMLPVLIFTVGWLALMASGVNLFIGMEKDGDPMITSAGVISITIGLAILVARWLTMRRQHAMNVAPPVPSALPLSQPIAFRHGAMSIFGLGVTGVIAWGSFEALTRNGFHSTFDGVAALGCLLALLIIVPTLLWRSTVRFGGKVVASGTVGLWLVFMSHYLGAWYLSHQRHSRSSADAPRERIIGEWEDENRLLFVEFRVDGTLIWDENIGVPIDSVEKRVVEFEGQYRWIDDRLEIKAKDQPTRLYRIVIRGDELTLLGNDGEVRRLKQLPLEAANAKTPEQRSLFGKWTSTVGDLRYEFTSHGVFTHWARVKADPQSPEVEKRVICRYRWQDDQLIEFRPAAGSEGEVLGLHFAKENMTWSVKSQHPRIKFVREHDGFVVLKEHGEVGARLKRDLSKSNDGHGPDKVTREQILGMWQWIGREGTTDFRGDGTFEEAWREKANQVGPDGLVEIDKPLVEKDLVAAGQYRWIGNDRLETKSPGRPDNQFRVVVNGDELTVLKDDGGVQRMKRMPPGIGEGHDFRRFAEMMNRAKLVGTWHSLGEKSGMTIFRSDSTFEDFQGGGLAPMVSINLGQYRWTDEEHLELKAKDRPARRVKPVIIDDELTLLEHDGGFRRLKRDNKLLGDWDELSRFDSVQFLTNETVAWRRWWIVNDRGHQPQPGEALLEEVSATTNPYRWLGENRIEITRENGKLQFDVGADRLTLVEDSKVFFLRSKPVDSQSLELMAMWVGKDETFQFHRTGTLRIYKVSQEKQPGWGTVHASALRFRPVGPGEIEVKGIIKGHEKEVRWQYVLKGDELKLTEDDGTVRELKRAKQYVPK